MQEIPDKYPTTLGTKPVEQDVAKPTALGQEEEELLQKDPSSFRALGEEDLQSQEPDFPMTVSLGEDEPEDHG